MTSLKDLKDKLMKNEGFKEAYVKSDQEYECLNSLIGFRLKAGLTQQQVAEKMKTSQLCIDRLEDGIISPTLSTIAKYANAVGCKFEVNITSK